MLSKNMNKIYDIMKNNLDRSGIKITLIDIVSSNIKPFAFILNTKDKKWTGRTLKDDIIISEEPYNFERNKHSDVFRILITYKKKIDTENSCYFRNINTGEILYIDKSMPALFAIGDNIIGVRYYSSVSGKTTGTYIYYNNRVWEPIYTNTEKVNEMHNLYLAPVLTAKGDIGNNIKIDDINFTADWKNTDKITMLKNVCDGDTINIYSLADKFGKPPKKLSVNSFGRKINIMYSDDIKVTVLCGRDDTDVSNSYSGYVYGLIVQNKSIRKTIRFNMEFDQIYRWSIFNHPQKMVVGIKNNKWYHLFKDNCIIKEIDEPKVYMMSIKHNNIPYVIMNISGELGILPYDDFKTCVDNHYVSLPSIISATNILINNILYENLVIIKKGDKIKIDNKDLVDFDNYDEVYNLCIGYLNSL